MGRENIDNWSVRKCSGTCSKCAKEFADKEALFSSLSFEEGAYVRRDYCTLCWNRDALGLSSWQTVFRLPPPQEEAVKKENAESLLRKLITRENKEDLNAIFILMVMLERKKVFVERDIQKAGDGRKLRIYEHRKTGESFVVADPELRLDELEHVQEEVVGLLGGKPRSEPPEPVAEDPKAPEDRD